MKRRWSAFLLLPLLGIVPASAKSELEQRVKNLEDRLAYYRELEQIVDRVETKSLKDKINFTPELRLRIDNFRYRLTELKETLTEGADGPADRDAVEGNPFDKSFDGHYSVRFRMGMESELSDNARLHGRLVIERSSQNNKRICILSRKETAASENVPTAMELDRAYVDYFFGSLDTPMVFSAGILPTSGGSSSNLIEGTTRKSLFPSLMFDSNMMGGIFTADLSRWAGADHTFLRLVAGKAFTSDPSRFYYQCNRETIQNMDITGLFLETSLGLLQDNTVYLGLNRAGNIKATPYLGASSAGTDLKNGEGLGEIVNLGAGIEARKVKGSRLDLFFHYALSLPDGNGNVLDFAGPHVDPATGVAYHEDGSEAFTSGTYAEGPMIDGDGHAYHTGFRYGFANGVRIGGEYNRGSETWWSVTQGSEDVFNKLATRGDAWEGYVTVPLGRSLSVRTGYLQIHEEYTGSGWHFGQPAEKDGVQKNYYLIVNALF